jgi:hypothetical protein
MAWLRLWLLRRPTAPLPPAAAWPTVGLGLCSFALWIGIDWWQSQPAPEFSSAGIPLFAWHALGLIAIAALLRWQARPALPFASACALLMGLVPVILVIVSLGAMFLAPRLLLYTWLLAGSYALIFLLRGLHALTNRPQGLAAATAALAIVGFLWTSDALNAIPDVWTPAATEDETGPQSSADAESILFEQSARIDAALAAMHRDPGAAAEGFFLGFAGDGAQKEFGEEITLAARVLGSRYHLDDRHLALINDERDLDTAPLATVSGLRYALQGIAARMHLDRDVLFLAISSHGSRDASIAVANSQLPLDDLTDEDLSEALKDSGIEWRVIILSACYAGAFIPPLHDPKTIVIAAAAADRTSFGCSTDRDLTYFGEAFYRDALPDAASLRDAFEKAKAAIAAREQREGIEASEPQADFGAAIMQKLQSAFQRH